MGLIDIGALNSYVIWTEKYPQWNIENLSRRKLFLIQLAKHLAVPNMKIRLAQNLHGNILNSIRLSAGALLEPDDSVNTEDAPTQSGLLSTLPTGMRCSFCSRKRDRKTRVMCCICKTPVCNDHRSKETMVKCLDCDEKGGH
jgi:hypothetical protein